MSNQKKVTLYNREGNSDKQYTMWLQEEKTGWTVQFQYGPRGGWVKDGTKTPKPVKLADAEKIYDKLLKEKKAKGYVEGEDAPVFSQTAGAVDSGLRPMLLTPDDEENVEKYLKDYNWAAQEKVNGKRIMIKGADGKIIGVNRRGLECPIPEEVQKALTGLNANLDGELIGSVYHVFDFPLPIELKLRWTVTGGFGDSVKFVPLVTGEENKRMLYRLLKDGRKEGIVFKKLDAVYEPGRREDLKKAIAVKVKFWAEANVEVLKWNKDKQSIEVGMIEKMTYTPSVGNVTVPTKYMDQIKVGKIVRVRYLYATANKILYQPKLDPTDDGNVLADATAPDPIGELKFEGKEE